MKTADDQADGDDPARSETQGTTLSLDGNAILEAMPLALFVKDAESRIVFMNRACEAMWGKPLSEIAGTDAGAIFPPEQMALFLAKDRAIFADGRMDEFEEVAWNARFGQNRIFRTIKMPVYDPAGRPLYLIGMTLDVSERVYSETEYRAILRTTLDGFWVNDLAGRFLDVNDVYCQMIGYERDQLLAMSIPDLEAEERPEETRAHIERVLATGFDRFQSRHRRKDGSVLDVEVTVNYLPVAGGRMVVFVRDITARKQAESALLASEERFRSIFENAGTAIAFGDQGGTLINFNTAFQQMLGYPEQRLRGMSFAEFTHPDDLAHERLLLEAVLDGGDDHYRLEKRVVTAEGEIKWTDTSVSAIRDPHGKVNHFIAILTDVTARHLAETTLNLYANVFRHSAEGIVITDTDNKIVAVNHAFTRLTGYQQEEVLGENPRILASGKTPAETYRAMWMSLYAYGYWQGEVWDRHKDGHLYPKWIAITALRDKSGAIINFIGSFTDITERKETEERISRLAHHDALTGLYNRFSLQDRLGQTLLAAQRDGKQVAVMFIDLDHFKTINDTLGHHVGDRLLVEVARRLLGIVRESDIVARLGGDEFVVVLSGIETGMAAVAVAKKVIQELGEPYAVDGYALHSSPSIGISLYPTDGPDEQTLMRNADTAMYHAKAQGRNNFQFFTEEMNATAIRRMRLEHDLRLALSENSLLLHYQPQVEASTGRFCGVEALVRWPHPEQGMVSPASFIPVAEESGLIMPLGEWVLNEACRQMAEWKAGGIPVPHVAINISAQQLGSPNLVGQIDAALAKHGLNPGELKLEITETTAMADPEHAIALLQALRDLGVTLAIDDFGTGYSSLAYLKRLPIQVLKLDMSFVKDIETDEDDAAICAATIALAHTLGIKVVAEGVETEAQRYFLATVHKCDMLQGYLFSRPLPAAGLEDWLAARQ
ncbi:MAG TPA: PAS domain S-box protein [Parasulfuritortus sp.]